MHTKYVFGSNCRRNRSRLLLASSLSVAGGLLSYASISSGATLTTFNPVEEGTTSGASLLSSAGITSGESDINPDLVTPLSTFGITVSAYNSAGTTGYLLLPVETPTFGTTTTYTGVGINGQNITVSSAETYNLSAGTTTDTVTISTPTNFLTTSKINNTTMTQMQLDLGDPNAGNETLNFSLPIGSQTSTGSAIYSTNTSLTLTPAVVLTNNTQSLYAAEGVNGGSAISAFTVHNFSYSVTYATVAVPEPAALSILSLATIGLLRRRRRIIV